MPIYLTKQVQEYGQIEPVVVRLLAESKFEILRNAETWLAVQRAGFHSVDIVVHEGLSDDDALEIIDEKGDLDAIKEAEWFKSQLKSSRRGGKFKSVAALARYIRLTRTYVSHSLRLLTLEPVLQDALKSGALNVGHAKSLLSLKNPDHRFAVATDAIRERWSVRKLEKEVRAIRSKGMTSAKSIKPDTKLPEVLSLERELSDLVGSRVVIEESTGKLTIDYRKNMDVLEGVLRRLGYSRQR